MAAAGTCCTVHPYFKVYDGKLAAFSPQFHTLEYGIRR